METRLHTPGSIESLILDAEYARLCEPDSSAVRDEIRYLAEEAEKAGHAARPAQLAQTFSLTALELDLLLVAAAPEVAPGIPRAAQLLEKMGAAGRPSVKMAMDAVSPGANGWLAIRRALAPAAQLQHWQLLLLADPDAPLAGRELVADSRISDFLLGGEPAGPEISGIARLRAGDTENLRSMELRGPEAVALRALKTFFQQPTEGRRLFLVLSGAAANESEDLATGILARIGMRLLVVEATALSAKSRTLALRESLLAQTGLLVHGLLDAGPELSDPADWRKWLTAAAPIVFLTQPVAHGRPPTSRPADLQAHAWVSVEMPAIDAGRRAHIWGGRLRELGLDNGGDSAAAQLLADAAQLSEREIAETAGLSASQAKAEGRQLTVDDLLAACRARIPHKLRELSQRIRCHASWNDLIVPPDSRSRLQELCRQAKLQQQVILDGGFGRRLARGRAVTGLLWGPSGTGKTLAAEVIGTELHRELYRVDSARVVSKYIGESEKNLRALFDEAERARCVLFFDEADALFGTRTEVRDSHDRYANLEVSYLLQLMEEAEHAVVLLASNRKQSIDDAFTRRFRFMVEFHIPNAALRRELWKGSFPPEFPLDASVRLDVLADRLELSGASIRNIALSAAFLAAGEARNAPKRITAAHLTHAIRREFEKLSGPVPITLAELTAPVPSRVRTGAAV